MATFVSLHLPRVPLRDFRPLFLHTHCTSQSKILSNHYFQDFLFGGGTKFEIEFDPIPHRKPKALSLGGDTISHLPVFGAQEPINGVVRVHGKKKVAHEGVSICLKGIIGTCICLV